MKHSAGIACLLAMSLLGCVASEESRPLAATSELLETYWRPAEVFGKPVVVHASTREPHVVLAREQSRMRGFTGCNSVSGAYTHDGQSLRFEKLLTTRRACVAPESNELESAFTKALEATASYRLVGETLELRDGAGAMHMRLGARYLR